MDLPSRLRHYRQALGITQADMARRLGAGVGNRQAVYDVESGRRPMPASWLRHLPAEFGDHWVTERTRSYESRMRRVVADIRGE